MGQFKVRGKGWRYNFILKGERYTDQWYTTKRAAQTAESKKRKELKNPPKILTDTTGQIQEDMGFWDLVNLRLDYLLDYKSTRHYTDNKNYAKRWCRKWGKLYCSDITRSMVQDFLKVEKQRASANTANKNLTLLRSLFNWGMGKRSRTGKRGEQYIDNNPTQGLEFFPSSVSDTYVPPKQDVLDVIAAGDEEQQDYLWTIALTLGRVGEINQLQWSHINLEHNHISLFTRKKADGSLTPRKLKIVPKLQAILKRRYKNKNTRLPYVFWHKYYSRNEKRFVIGPYVDRKKLMKSLIEKANKKREKDNKNKKMQKPEILYFRFHPLRHFGATALAEEGVPIREIQHALGHEKLTTTEIYLHKIGAVSSTAMDQLGKVYA